MTVSEFCYAALIDESGYATVRMDKPGVGESQGECAKADFESEITGGPAALKGMTKYDFIDLDRVFVVGLSNGGGFSPMAPRDHCSARFHLRRSWGCIVQAQVGTGAPPADGSEEVRRRR